jgi:hypothetical protein
MSRREGIEREQEIEEMAQHKRPGSEDKSQNTMLIADLLTPDAAAH